jgi:hypothetical protein
MIDMTAPRMIAAGMEAMAHSTMNFTMLPNGRRMSVIAISRMSLVDPPRARSVRTDGGTVEGARLTER